MINDSKQTNPMNANGLVSFQFNNSSSKNPLAALDAVLIPSIQLNNNSMQFQPQQISTSESHQLHQEPDKKPLEFNPFPADNISVNDSSEIIEIRPKRETAQFAPLSRTELSPHLPSPSIIPTKQHSSLWSLGDIDKNRNVDTEDKDISEGTFEINRKNSKEPPNQQVQKDLNDIFAGFIDKTGNSQEYHKINQERKSIKEPFEVEISNIQKEQEQDTLEINKINEKQYIDIYNNPIDSKENQINIKNVEQVDVKQEIPLKDSNTCSQPQQQGSSQSGINGSIQFSDGLHSVPQISIPAARVYVDEEIHNPLRINQLLSCMSLDIGVALSEQVESPTQMNRLDFSQHTGFNTNSNINSMSNLEHINYQISPLNNPRIQQSHNVQDKSVLKKIKSHTEFRHHLQGSLSSTDQREYDQPIRKVSASFGQLIESHSQQQSQSQQQHQLQQLRQPHQHSSPFDDYDYLKGEENKQKQTNLFFPDTKDQLLNLNENNNRTNKNQSINQLQSTGGITKSINNNGTQQQGEDLQSPDFMKNNKEILSDNLHAKEITKESISVINNEQQSFVTSCQESFYSVKEKFENCNGEQFSLDSKRDEGVKAETEESFYSIKDIEGSSIYHSIMSIGCQAFNTPGSARNDVKYVSFEDKQSLFDSLENCHELPRIGTEEKERGRTFSFRPFALTGDGKMIQERKHKMQENHEEQIKISEFGRTAQKNESIEDIQEKIIEFNNQMENKKDQKNRSDGNNDDGKERENEICQKIIKEVSREQQDIQTEIISNQQQLQQQLQIQQQDEHQSLMVPSKQSIDSDKQRENVLSTRGSFLGDLNSFLKKGIIRNVQEEDYIIKINLKEQEADDNKHNKSNSEETRETGSNNLKDKSENEKKQQTQQLRKGVQSQEDNRYQINYSDIKFEKNPFESDLDDQSNSFTINDNNNHKKLSSDKCITSMKDIAKNKIKDEVIEDIQNDGSDEEKAQDGEDPQNLKDNNSKEKDDQLNQNLKQKQNQLSPVITQNISKNRLGSYSEKEDLLINTKSIQEKERQKLQKQENFPDFSGLSPISKDKKRNNNSSNTNNIHAPLKLTSLGTESATTSASTHPQLSLIQQKQLSAQPRMSELLNFDQSIHEIHNPNLSGSSSVSEFTHSSSSNLGDSQLNHFTLNDSVENIHTNPDNPHHNSNKQQINHAFSSSPQITNDYPKINVFFYDKEKQQKQLSDSHQQPNQLPYPSNTPLQQQQKSLIMISPSYPTSSSTSNSRKFSLQTFPKLAHFDSNQSYTAPIYPKQVESMYTYIAPGRRDSKLNPNFNFYNTEESYDNIVGNSFFLQQGKLLDITSPSHPVSTASKTSRKFSLQVFPRLAHFDSNQSLTTPINPKQVESMITFVGSGRRDSTNQLGNGLIGGQGSSPFVNAFEPDVLQTSWSLLNQMGAPIPIFKLATSYFNQVSSQQSTSPLIVPSSEGFQRNILGALFNIESKENSTDSQNSEQIQQQQQQQQQQSVQQQVDKKMFKTAYSQNSELLQVPHLAIQEVDELFERSPSKQLQETQETPKISLFIRQPSQHSLPQLEVLQSLHSIEQPEQTPANAGKDNKIMKINIIEPDKPREQQQQYVNSSVAQDISEEEQRNYSQKMLENEKAQQQQQQAALDKETYQRMYQQMCHLTEIQLKATEINEEDTDPSVVDLAQQLQALNEKLLQLQSTHRSMIYNLQESKEKQLADAGSVRKQNQKTRQQRGDVLKQAQTIEVFASTEVKSKQIQQEPLNPQIKQPQKSSQPLISQQQQTQQVEVQSLPQVVESNPSKGNYQPPPPQQVAKKVPFQQVQSSAVQQALESPLVLLTPSSSIEFANVATDSLENDRFQALLDQFSSQKNEIKIFRQDLQQQQQGQGEQEGVKKAMVRQQNANNRDNNNNSQINSVTLNTQVSQQNPLPQTNSRRSSNGIPDIQTNQPLAKKSNKDNRLIEQLTISNTSSQIISQVPISQSDVLMDSPLDLHKLRRKNNQNNLILPRNEQTNQLNEFNASYNKNKNKDNIAETADGFFKQNTNNLFSKQPQGFIASNDGFTNHRRNTSEVTNGMNSITSTSSPQNIFEIYDKYAKKNKLQQQYQVESQGESQQQQEFFQIADPPQSIQLSSKSNNINNTNYQRSQNFFNQQSSTSSSFKQVGYPVSSNGFQQNNQKQQQYLPQQQQYSQLHHPQQNTHSASDPALEQAKLYLRQSISTPFIASNQAPLPSKYFYQPSQQNIQNYNNNYHHQQHHQDIPQNSTQNQNIYTANNQHTLLYQNARYREDNFHFSINQFKQNSLTKQNNLY